MKELKCFLLILIMSINNAVAKNEYEQVGKVLNETDQNCATNSPDNEQCKIRIANIRTNEILRLPGKKDVNLIDISDYSSDYHVTALLEKCDDNGDETSLICYITFNFKNKKSKINILPISSNDLIVIENGITAINYLNLDQPIYGKTYSVVFNDFNFDGLEDFALWTGVDGRCGGPTYSIYLFDNKENKFIINTEMSAITKESLGLFKTIDNKLVAFDKSGCCNRSTYSYVVVDNQPVLDEVVEEILNDDDTFTVTTYKFENGEKKQVKREIIRESN